MKSEVFDTTEQDYRLTCLNKLHCSMFGDVAVLVEGHKGLKNFSSQKIVFEASKKQNFNIIGKNLVIKQLAIGYALVVGTVEGVAYESIS